MQQNKDGEQKSYNQFGLFSLVFLLSFSTLSASNFENFKRLQTKSFSTYKDEKDNAFNTYLKAQWQEYEKKASKPLYEKSKPKEIIPTKIKQVKSLGPRITIKDDTTKKKIIIKKKIVNKKVQKDINFDFFGSQVGFNIDKKLRNTRFYPQDKRGILNFFNIAASSEYEDVVSGLKRLCIEMQLNDWGVYKLVTKLSKTIYQNQDDANLFSWFIFNKLGYATKIGLSQRHTVLLFYSKKIIYSTPSYTFSNKKYYVVSKYAKGRLGRLYSYEQNYPNAHKELDLSMQKIPKFALDLKQKEIKFKEYAKTYTINLEYNQNLIDFMSTYPQADYKTYFNAPLDEVTYDSIVKSLKIYVDGKKATDAINFILHFVQKSFKYERDNEQFFREKVMFAQETLYFDKS
ncbi:MAG: hypothetical protein GXO30_02860, partial [Epsilonproteobacteria bacterium]|nr:hypothetical protein [Campylobacterota bacterium]